MKLHIKHFCLVGLLAFSALIFAQENSMFLLRSLPQANEINTSSIPQIKGYIGFPALSSLRAEYYNSGFALEDIIHSGNGNLSDSLVIDYNSFSNALNTNNVYFQEVSNNWLGFGFKIKKSFFTASLSSKYKTRIFYPGSIGDISKGNYNFDNGTYSSLTTNGMSMDGIAYNEIAFGWAYPVKENLTIGVRIKLIGGVVNVKSEQLNLTISTQSNSELLFKTDAIIQTNLPLTITVDSLNHVDSIAITEDIDIPQFIKDNMGFGFDAGITYNPTSRLSIGLALNDIGIISYKSTSNTFRSNGTFKYSGVDLTGMFGNTENTNSNYWEMLDDSLRKSFTPTASDEKYSSGLQGNVVITGAYRMQNWLDLGALLKTQFYQGRPYPSLGLACGMTPNKLISTSISYSMRKGNYLNLGAGVVFKPGPFQIYLITDNITGAFALEKAKSINFRFGMNFIFGTGKPKVKQTLPNDMKELTTEVKKNNS